jgi:hypothetical protein
LKIYLHIGLEKTGTTSIQEFLTYKRDELINKKILYAKSLHLPNNEYISVAFRNEEYVDDLRIKHNITNPLQILKFREIIKDNLQQEINKYNPDILIISNEHISSRIKEEEERKNLINFLRNFSDDITMIVYLRRQDKFLESLYSTSIISGNTYSFEKFFQQIIYRQDLHFYKFLKSWEEFINKKNIIVRNFEKNSLYKNDIVEDFIKILNLDIKKDKNFKNNTSLGFKKLAFLRHFNMFSPMIKNNKFNYFRGNIVNILRNIKIENDSKIKLTLNQLKILSNLYDEENKKVSKEYFQSNENIFRFDFNDIQNEHKVKMIEHFEIFSKIWEKRQIEFERLKIKNMLLQAKLAIKNNNKNVAENILNHIKKLPYINELNLNNEIQEIKNML